LFTTNRRNLIKKIVLENRRVDVSNLSEQFSVSEVTIRKDLEYLEKQGFLIRIHGGAILNEMSSGTSGEYPSVTEDSHIKTIGKIVSCLIEDGDLLYLGTGSLCTQIALNLKEKNNLTIITNNLAAAMEISENPKIRIILPPGLLMRVNGFCSLVGSETMTFLENRLIDKAIIGADAVRFSVGFTLQDDELCRISRRMLENADKRIIAISSENFNRNAFSLLGELTIANTVVSDEHMPEDYVQFFYENNVRVFTSYDIENL
jgi:DeoR/GlpR family transcriptional regulator of sugar metabolism